MTVRKLMRCVSVEADPFRKKTWCVLLQHQDGAETLLRTTIQGAYAVGREYWVTFNLVAARVEPAVAQAA